MRLLEKFEIKKRGCIFCAHIKEKSIVKEYEHGAKSIVIGRFCPFEQCPYTELDEYGSYEEYFKHHKHKI